MHQHHNHEQHYNSEHHHKPGEKGDFEAQRIQEMKHKDPKLGGNQWIEKATISGEKSNIKHIGTNDEQSPH
jgi:hypothetical protein